MKDNLKLTGNVIIEHKSSRWDKPVVTERHNTVVTLGKAQLAKSIVSGAYASSAPFGWMSIGIGSDTIVASDTTLGSEYLKYAGGSVTGSTTTTTTLNDTSRWIGSFGIADTKVINEAGLFNASGLNLGSMLSRVAFADKSAISGDQLNITWDIDFS